MEVERMKKHRLEVEHICTYMSYGKYWEGASETDKKRIRCASKKHILENGVLFYVGADGMKTEVITSLAKVKEIVAYYHGSREAGVHSGISATVEKISSVYRWGSVRKDVIHYVKRCAVCQKHKVIKIQAPAVLPIKVKKPLELVQLDPIVNGTDSFVAGLDATQPSVSGSGGESAPCLIEICNKETEFSSPSKSLANFNTATPHSLDSWKTLRTKKRKRASKGNKEQQLMIEHRKDQKAESILCQKKMKLEIKKRELEIKKMELEIKKLELDIKKVELEVWLLETKKSKLEKELNEN